MDARMRIWQFSLLLWVGAGLSFMAAMSVSSILFCALSLFFLGLGVSWQRSVGASQFTWATIALVLVCAGSLLMAWIWPPLGIAPEGFGVVKKFLYFVQPLLVGWALLSLTQHQNYRVEEHSLWTVLFWTTLVMSLIAIFQFWAGNIFGAEFVEGRRFFRPVAGSVHSHAQGLMFFHLSFASAMCFSYCYALARTLWPAPGDSKWQRAACCLLALCTGLAIIYTYSRISWITLILVSALLFLLWKPRRFALAVLGLVLITTLAYQMSSELRIRLYDVPGYQDRFYLYRNSWMMFVDRPIQGVGFAKSGQYADLYAQHLYGKNETFGSHAHNNLLEMLATTGIPGLVAYLLWWGMLFYYAWRSFCRAKAATRWLPAALLAGGVAFQLNGLTQVNFFDAKSQHSMVLWAGLVLALTWREKFWQARASE